MTVEEADQVYIKYCSSKTRPSACNAMEKAKKHMLCAEQYSISIKSTDAETLFIKDLALKKFGSDKIDGVKDAMAYVQRAKLTKTGAAKLRDEQESWAQESAEKACPNN